MVTEDKTSAAASGSAECRRENWRAAKLLSHRRGQGLGAAIARKLIDEGCELAVDYFSSRDGAETMVKWAGEAGRKAASFLRGPDQSCGRRRPGGTSHGIPRRTGHPRQQCGRSGGAASRGPGPGVLVGVQDINVNSRGLGDARGGAAPGPVSRWVEHHPTSTSLAGRKSGHPGSLAYSHGQGCRDYMDPSPGHRTRSARHTGQRRGTGLDPWHEFSSNPYHAGFRRSHRRSDSTGAGGIAG